MKKDTLVLYHASCTDGIGAAYACWEYFQEHADYLPVQYNDPIPDVEGKDVIIVDFSYKADALKSMAEKAKKILLIDHHKTAIDNYSGIVFPDNVKLVLDTNRSGAILAYHTLFPSSTPPLLLEYIQDRDLHKYTYRETEPITTALYEIGWSHPRDLKKYMDTTSPELNNLVALGRILVKAENKKIETLYNKSHYITLNNDKTSYRVLACNAPQLFATKLGHKLAEKTSTYGAVYSFDGRLNKWVVSLRSVGNFDVGRIAKTFGGGGHLNAAGCSLEIGELVI